METILEKLYKLGLLKHPATLSDKEKIARLKKEFNFPSETLDIKHDKTNLIKTITRYYNESIYHYISSYTDLSSVKTHVISTTDNFNIDKITYGYCDAIVNLHKINDIRRINKFFELINTKLPHLGIFIGCCETLELRHKKLLNKYPLILNAIILTMDYIFKRVFAKLMFTRKIYFWLTGGRNRILSRAETLGRLYSCGFEVVDEKTIGYLYFFTVRKINEPAYDLNPSYGLLFPMPRTGLNGEKIRVYKLRTMYPFSEYLQAYVYDNNNLDISGKFKNDFRITAFGRLMRRFWIDELPMIYNLIKRDLKLVGIRPLSKHFQSLYPDDLIKLRHKFRPGLIPPYYADMPNSLKEIIESEKRYLKAYEKAPLRTDWKYFRKALINIIFNKARSK